MTFAVTVENVAGVCGLNESTLTLETPEEGEIMHTMGKGGTTDKARLALAMGEGGVAKK